MKKILVIALSAFVAVVAFFGAMVTYANMTGGVSPENTLAGLPVIHRWINTRAPEEAETGRSAQAEAPKGPPPRSVSFLRFGTRRELEELVAELEVNNDQCNVRLNELERRARELDAWERQLEKERENLTAKFDKERDDIARLRRELSEQEAALAQRRISFKEAETSNLKKTAKVYASMEAEKAAALLGRLYEKDAPETVVKIIHLMDDRSAGKVLAAMRDVAVGAEITRQLARVHQAAQEEQ